jgi:hypothetical protein
MRTLGNDIGQKYVRGWMAILGSWKESSNSNYEHRHVIDVNSDTTASDCQKSLGKCISQLHKFDRKENALKSG